MTLRTALFIGLTSVLATTCDRPQISEPLTTNISAQYSSSSEGLPIPATNEGGGAVGLTEIGTLPMKKWGMITVHGSVHLSKNPALTECDPSFTPPAAGSSAGPRGLPGSPKSLNVSVFRGVTSLALYLIDGDSSSAKILRPIYNKFDSEEAITASRNGVGGSKYPCDGPGDTSIGIAYYAMAGNQTVTLDVLPDPEVNALQTLVASGDTVTFAAESSPQGISPYWLFVT